MMTLKQKLTSIANHDLNNARKRGETAITDTKKGLVFLQFNHTSEEWAILDNQGKIYLQHHRKDIMASYLVEQVYNWLLVAKTNE